MSIAIVYCELCAHVVGFLKESTKGNAHLHLLSCKEFFISIFCSFPSYIIHRNSLMKVAKSLMNKYRSQDA